MQRESLGGTAAAEETAEEEGKIKTRQCSEVVALRYSEPPAVPQARARYRAGGGGGSGQASLHQTQIWGTDYSPFTSFLECQSATPLVLY